MQKWEYKIEEQHRYDEYNKREKWYVGIGFYWQGNPPYQQNPIDKLNSLGEEGWELVQVVRDQQDPYGTNANRILYYFKRPING